MEKRTLEEIRAWHVRSPEAPGLHEVVVPGRSDCREVRILRLNLVAGEPFTLASGALEMNGVVVAGELALRGAGLDGKLGKYDSFYIPGGCSLELAAQVETTLYIGAARCAGMGKHFVRQFDLSLPLGEIHQIHGEGAGRREVFFTLNPETPASRLICGLTWGGDGSWTSWPPHQHEKDLEEVYCYFDMDPPQLGLHLSYLTGTAAHQAVVHPVASGSMVLAPQGYHPTVAAPGTRNTYFWVLAAFEPGQRAYDRAITDPAYLP